MSGILVAQFSQLTFQKVLNIHVLLHGHLTLVTQNLHIFSQYPFKLLLEQHSTKTGTKNLDTQPEITAGGRMQQLKHHFCTDVPLHLIILNYSHTKIH